MVSPTCAPGARGRAIHPHHGGTRQLRQMSPRLVPAAPVQDLEPGMPGEHPSSTERKRQLPLPAPLAERWEGAG